MKVLFWVSKFPTFSETFIRDQIAFLKEAKIDVLIYPKSGRINDIEQEALIGFEKYKLSNDICNIDKYFYTSKIKRFITTIVVLLISLFNGNFKFYLKSLSIKQFGKQAKSLRLLFRVHFILKHNVDIIHAHFGPNGNEASVLKAVGLPIKLFTTFHGYDIRLGLKNDGEIYSKLFEFTDGIISISEFNTKHLLDFGLDSSKLIAIPNGINVDFFKGNDVGDIQPKDKLMLLTVARLVEEKALHIAITAIDSLLKVHPDLELSYTIIGEGIKRKELENLIEHLGLTNTITLTGSKTTTEVREFMLSSDVFLLPSLAEALPTVLLEAQAAGLIVLATDVGAVKTIVFSGEVVEPNNVEDFTKGLVKLIAQRVVWDVLSEKGRDHITAYYNIVDQTEKLLTYYRKSL